LSLDNASVTTAEIVAPGKFTEPGSSASQNSQRYGALPEFCRIALTLTPSPDSDIKMELWIPTQGWNGKYMGVGNGAFTGSVRYTSMINPSQAELMAPVGSYEALQAAIQAGAHSIYFGVTQLNMRARAAANFTLNDLDEIMKRCHQAGLKAYLVVNTLLYDHDITIMKLLVDRALEAGVDAIIAFDFATIQYCNQINIPVHVSVQFSVSNYESLKFFAQFTNRVVLARELTLDQIKDIYIKIQENQLMGRE